MTHLIINADDYGQTKSCTDAIIEAFEKKLISDTTMITNGNCFDYAVTEALSHRYNDRIGIHFNITEGIPLTQGIKNNINFVKDGTFFGKINRIKLLSKQDKKDVYFELSAQVEKFYKSGLKISHADSHHHIHTAMNITPIFIEVCQKYKITKIRLHRNIGNITILKRAIKMIYNKYLSSKGFQTTDYFGSVTDVIYGLPNGITEIMVHPDYDKNHGLIDRISYDKFPIGKRLVNIKEIIQKGDFSSYKEL